MGRDAAYSAGMMLGSGNVCPGVAPVLDLCRRARKCLPQPGDVKPAALQGSGWGSSPGTEPGAFNMQATEPHALCDGANSA